MNPGTFEQLECSAKSVSRNKQKQYTLSQQVQAENKKDLKGTFGVEHLNHSKNWKINLEERARKVQKSIGVQVEEQNLVKQGVVLSEEGDEPR